MSASVSTDTIDLFITTAGPGLPETDSRRLRLEELAAEASKSLERWFGVAFTFVNAATAEVLHVAADQPCRDWAYRAELCQQVAFRRQAEFIEEDHPLLMLALPIEVSPDCCLVGVATFTSRALTAEDELVRAAAMLRCDLEAARRWAARQTPIAAATLERLSELVLAKQVADGRIAGLESEIEKLSLHVSSTYEEVSLIYRLTQNLKISSTEDDLGNLALEWLVEIMPFEGLSLLLLPHRDGSNSTADARRDNLMLTHGRCPLGDANFCQLVEHLGLHRAVRPLVLNRNVTGKADWPFPEIRELVILPVGEGEQIYGFLAAFNHTSGGEFGTVEADLLSSVAAILNIHSGNAELYRQQADLLSGIVRALTSAIDAKDPYTCGHSDRVARVAVRLAQELGCSQQTIETIYLSGLLHDVGKIGIDDQVLRKPGKLTPAEFEHIKTHSRIGYNILVDLKQLGPVLPVVLSHHESWDGSGYPEGLAAETIPELARIVAVADAFDAMGSDRPYRQGMPDEKLDNVIRAGAGKQWDPQVVDAFFRARADIRAIAKRDDQSSDIEHYL